MEEYEPETELEENIEISYNISILDEEYELTMKLNELLLEFKLQQKNIIDEYYYKSKFELNVINRLLFTSFERIKEAFDFFNNLFKEKKIKLVKSKDKDIIKLNFVNITQKNETNVELKKYKLTKDEMNLMFMKEINTLKKKLNSKNEKSLDVLIKNNNKQLTEYIDKKIEESKKEYQQILEEKIKEKHFEINDLNKKLNKLNQEQEKKLNEIENVHEIKASEIEKISVIKKEKEKEKEKNEIIKFNKLNDNVNLIIDFNNINVENMKNKTIVNNLKIKWMKSVAVYKIIKNNEIMYEIAYPYNKNGYNIILYNLLLNGTTNIINNAHQNNIHRIKHYYDPSSNNHILLTSSADKSIKLWNISSNPISNILYITNCFDGVPESPFCLMFNKEDYYILGGSTYNKKNIWDKNGKIIGSIEKSKLRFYTFIETTYIDNIPYILLSGDCHSVCYDYNNDNIKIFKSNNKKNIRDIHYIVNLFKNNNNLYIISGDEGGNIIIFDFISTKEIITISVGGHIYSLCSLNEKYILVGNNKNELKVFGFYNKSIIKNYKAHNNLIYGIEKIKILNKKEYIITYGNDEINLWE